MTEPRSSIADACAEFRAAVDQLVASIASSPLGAAVTKFATAACAVTAELLDALGHHLRLRRPDGTRRPRAAVNARTRSTSHGQDPAQRRARIDWRRRRR